MNTSSLWHPQAHMPTTAADPLVIARGEGAYVETEQGQRLLDATAGLWHVNIGHGREEVADAAAAQMKKLETYHLFGRFANRPALELADRVTALGPIENAKVFWTSGGSDSVELASKLSRLHWQLEGRKDKLTIVSRHNAYHGLHGFGTSIAGIPPNRADYGTDSLVPETLRVAHSDLAAVEAEIDRIGPDRVAAIFAEPIIGTGGVITPPVGYLAGLQRLCRQHDILFVVDEVITGFGRVGTLFASERFQLEPDLVLMAKGITSGYAPLGGVLVAPRVWRRFFEGDDAPMFRHGITYSGHATACAVAMANLDILERENLVDRVASLEAVLRTEVATLAHSPLVAEVRCGAGFMAGIRLNPEVPGAKVADRILDRGVITRVLVDNVLQICPPFVIEPKEIADMVKVFATVLDEMAVSV
ncbi:aspartate aminotransferase family protein [Nocardia pseudovaccinii]|uniref:aminotransferase family protein n=1 Tax=Nocardia pseudovaccinii TaxID=189540 RepID=UPI003D902C40